MATEAKAASIMVVGSTMIDLITYYDRMPEQGETLFGKEFAQGFGGKGANQAVMSARLGAQVAMVNSVGADSFGRDTIANFENEGIDASQVKQDEDSHSGVAFILVDPSGDNRIILAAGANLTMTPEQVDEAFDALPTPDVVLCQLEVPQEVIQRAFEKGKEAGATTVLNPAPAAEVDRAILDLTDWLIPNETEFAIIAKTVIDSDDVDDYSASIVEFAKATDTSTIITLGEKGALLYELGDDDPVTIEAPQVEVVDTTGAGDAFCGTFVVALGAGLAPADAIKVAGAVASDSVTRKGTQTSYPPKDKLAELARQNGLEV